MTTSIVTNLFVSFGLVASPAFAPSAADASRNGLADRPLPQVVSSAAAATFESRRETIFLVLRGGESTLADDVVAHLWKLAGRLAASDWSPPKMNVDVVVKTMGNEK